MGIFGLNFEAILDAERFWTDDLYLMDRTVTFKPDSRGLICTYVVANLRSATVTGVF